MNLPEPIFPVLGLLAFISVGVPIIELIITVVLYCTIYSTTFWYVVGIVVFGTAFIVWLANLIRIYEEEKLQKQIN